MDGDAGDRPPTSLGLILPIGSITTSADLRDLLVQTGIGSVWVRDLPVTGAGDADAGQRSDPWWCLAGLAATLPPDITLGTASIILGIRHPLVVARAAADAHRALGGRFVLGVGTGGKPPMNSALGIADRTYEDFAAAWRAMRRAVHNDLDPSVRLAVPTGYTPPPVWLATSDLRRWYQIDGDADGWQTFLTDDRRRFDELYRGVCALRGGPTPVDVRVDVELVHPDQAASTPVFTQPARGRVRCSPDQLHDVLRGWMGEPVRRILVRAHGHAPDDALRQLTSSLC